MADIRKQVLSEYVRQLMEEELHLTSPQNEKKDQKDEKDQEIEEAEPETQDP